jgi:acylglycerol lipase
LIGENVRQRFPELPLFVWGHSMGSVVVILAAQDLKWARGLITTGCALDAMPKLDGAAGVVLRIASVLAPRLRISLRIDASALTQVLEEQHRHMSDPLVPRTASLRLLYGFAKACRACRMNAPNITLPWLAVHGEADKVCPISGSQTLIHALGSRDKQLVTYPNLLHEVHNEGAASRAALFELMSRWILERA